MVLSRVKSSFRRTMQVFLFTAMLFLNHPVFAQDEATPAPAAVAEPAKAPPVESAKPEGEYEIDYEEEEGADTGQEEVVPEPTPEPVKTKKGKRVVDKGGGAGGTQGSRAKERPSLKAYIPSDTFSVYKKEGKAIRVDSD